jgi:hypothetical protein
VKYAFELRNIVSALSFVWDDPVNRTEAAISPEQLGDLKHKVRERLRSNLHREDLSSSIALAQTLAYLEAPARVNPALALWMQDQPRTQQQFDVGLQVRAVIALGQREPDPRFLSSASQGLRQAAPKLTSLAPVIRVLDALAVLHQARLLGNDPASARDLAEMVCSLLDRFRAESEIGWVSVEATADVTRGLIALLDRLPPGNLELAARVSEHVATGVTALRHAFHRYERNTRGVAWLARLSHAVMLVDRHFPIGLQRLASLEWPERPTEEPSGASTGRSLLDYLAAENKNLREKERLLEEGRLAGSLGRGTATLLGLALVVVPFVVLLTVVGYESWLVLAGNLGVVLTLLLGILPGLFALLARWHLLAGPVARVNDWIAAAVPLVSGVGKLKRK